MKTREFDRGFLRDLDLPWACIDRELVGRSRWSVEYCGVFQYEGKFYRICWSQGATESQDERPWECEETVTATEVVKRPVTTEQWVPVEDDEGATTG